MLWAAPSIGIAMCQIAFLLRDAESLLMAMCGRPDLNTEGSVIEAASALAVIGPMPGMVCRRWLVVSD